MSHIFHVQTGDISLAAETIGAGCPLVFSHGLTDNRQQGPRLLAALLGAFRLIVFDQRGHGDSTPVIDPVHYDSRLMAEDITSVMDALNIPRTVIAGESMGSATALLCALYWPERVEQLLLIAPAFGDTPNPSRDSIKQLGQRLSTAQSVDHYISTASRGEWKEAGFSPEAMACIASYYRSHQPASIAVACQTVADWVILHSIDDLAALRVPVHILAWDGDPIHPVALAQAMADAIPDTRLTILPSAATLFNDMELAGRTFAESLTWDSAPPGV
jgi:pimeloyl-ACP methyl ester carboxylesterase